MINDKVFRPLVIEDYHKQYLDLLKQLSEVGDISYEKFTMIFPKLAGIYVIEDLITKKIIGSITLLIEQKIIHNAGRVAHIEDVVISKEYRKCGLGNFMVRQAIQEAEELGCYKVILDCDDRLISFYEKCGLKRKGTQMAHYFIHTQ